MISIFLYFLLFFFNYEKEWRNEGLNKRQKREKRGQQGGVIGLKKKGAGAVEENAEVVSHRLHVSTQLWLWVPHQRRSGLPNKIPVPQKRSDRNTHHAKLVQQKKIKVGRRCLNHSRKFNLSPSSTEDSCCASQINE